MLIQDEDRFRMETHAQGEASEAKAVHREAAVRQSEVSVGPVESERDLWPLVPKESQKLLLQIQASMDKQLEQQATL
jgi:hypothetical protein